VGSFSSAKKKLASVISAQDLRVLAENSQAFLGICVGMQLLCESGSEDEITPGYGFFSGQVDRIPNASILPHMGWNNLVGMELTSPLLKGISPVDDFYFVHSYSLVGGKNSQIIASTEYGSIIPAVVGDNNIFGVQFHPEKSSTAGSKLLTNFLSI
jgi:glutamine amidotransferase